MNIQNLVLDINKKPFLTITANVGEVASRFIRITMLDNNMPIDLTGVAVSLYAEKPDSKKVFNNVTIEDEKNGIIFAELTSQILAVEGLVKLTLLLVKNGGKLCSKQFLLNVDGSIVDDKAIESTNEFTALVNALGKVNSIENKADKEQVDSLEKKINDFSNKINNILVGYIDFNDNNAIGITGLPQGTYTLRYKNSDGVISNYDIIGEVEV